MREYVSTLPPYSRRRWRARGQTSRVRSVPAGAFGGTKRHDWSLSRMDHTSGASNPCLRWHQPTDAGDDAPIAAGEHDARVIARVIELFPAPVPAPDQPAWAAPDRSVWASLGSMLAGVGCVALAGLVVMLGLLALLALGVVYGVGVLL
jgi:hypothetical protein